MIPKRPELKPLALILGQACALFGIEWNEAQGFEPRRTSHVRAILHNRLIEQLRYQHGAGGAAYIRPYYVNIALARVSGQGWY